ncbi:MAG: oligosaccharide flippase family protein [bacterium]|nr:oligosaccharide flippase family protein [bacterium]
MQKLKQKIKNLLIWSQKYTQTDNIYLFKGGGWLILGQTVAIVASFLLAIAFANLLNPATYGKYKYIISWAEIFGIFSIGGINVAISQAVARGLEGSFYSGFKNKIKWGALGSLAAMALAIYYFIRGDEALSIPLFIAAMFLPLMKASYLYGNFLAGKKLFGIATKYDIVSKIIFLVSMVIALYLTKNLLWLIVVYFASNTFLNYFFYLWTKYKFQPNKKEDPQTLSYGKHLSLSGIIGRGTNELDKVLLFNFIGPIELAVYSFAILIPNQITNILTNINSLAFPKLATKSQEEIKKNLMKKVWKLSFLVGIVMTVYIIIAPFIYKILFPQYLTSIHYSQLVIFSLVIVPFSLLDTFFSAKMMKKEIYILRITGVVRLILFVALIPLYGILGAILALVGAKVFRSALLLFLFYRLKPR